MSGGALALVASGRSDADTTSPAPTPVSTATTPATDFTQVRATIERVLPAIVTVVADLPERQENGETVQTTNLGSGIVIDDAGHVVTNFHVIEGAETLSIVLATGEQRPARLLGDDSPFTDLAVLQAPAQGLRSVPLSSSRDARIGDPVVALSGSAIVGQNSAALGILGGTRRNWARPGVVLEDLLQTDAAVNHGDSGGALVNLQGQIIGLLTTVVRQTPTGLDVEGIAFAQSTDSLRDAIDGIIRTGKSKRSRIGIERFTQHQEITPALAARRGLPVPQGALVTSVSPGSPAAAAGMVPGDIVVALNGVAVDFETPLPNLLKGLRPGERVELTVLRGGNQIRLVVSPTLE